MDTVVKRHLFVLLVVTGTVAIISGYSFDIVYVRDGETVKLECPLSPVDSWQEIDTRQIVAVCTKEENMIYTDNSSITRKMFVTSNCHFGIHNFTVNDPRGFQCISPNGTHKINIGLIELPSNMIIENATKKGEVYGIAGESVTITCRVNSGIPKETMTWTKQDELVSKGGPHELQYTFNASQSDDNSIMTCSAKNTAFNTAVTKKVIFKILKKPTVMLKAIPYSTVQEGTTIALICESSSESPLDTFSWKHNDVSFEGFLNKSMTISTKKSDAGRYSCIASNNVGTSIANVTIIVTYAPVVKNSNIIFNLDELNRNLQCDASGIPNEYTYARWQHLTVNDQFIRYLHGSDKGTLLLPQQENEEERYQDSGIYVCTVSNNVSDANGGLWQMGRINVTIKGRPVLAESNKTKIQFGYFNSTSNIVLNLLSSTGISNVSWFDENKLLQTNEFCTITMIPTQLFGREVSIFGYRCSMTITNTRPDDFQKYSVKVDNEIGSNHFQIILKSASIPVTPTIISILPRINDIEVGWIPMFNGGQNQSFIVEYRKRLDDAWKNITVHSDTYKQQKISHIYGLQPETEYEVRMYAFNTIGKSVVTKIFFAKTEKSTDLIILYAILGLVAIVSIAIFAAKIIYKWINKGVAIENDLYHSAAELGRPASAYGTHSDVYSSMQRRHSIVDGNQVTHEVQRMANCNTTCLETIYPEGGDVCNNKYTRCKFLHTESIEKYRHRREEKLEYCCINNSGNYRNKIQNRALIYVDVVFDPVSPERRYYIHGADNRTPYADIDFAATVDPSYLNASDSSSSED